MVIECDQQKFEQLLSLGNTISLSMRKHRNISLSKAPLANSWNHASCGVNKTLSKPITTPSKANKALSKLIIASTISGEAIRVSGDPMTTSSEANKASPKLVLASDKAISLVPGHQAMLYDIAYEGAKAKAHLSGEVTSQAFYNATVLFGGAKIASSGKANASYASDEAVLQVYYKMKALCGSAKIVSSGKANASNTYGEDKLAD